MLSSTAKTFLIIELAVCFTPVISFLGAGMMLILPGWSRDPSLLLDLDHFVFELAPIAGGMLGLIALYSVTNRILDDTFKAIRPTTALVFVLCGVASIMPFVISDVFAPFRWIFILPLIATFHIMYLGKEYLLGKS